MTSPDELLIDFIVEGHHEFSIAEEPTFIKLLKSLDREFKIPSRQTVQRKIVTLFDKKKRRLGDVLNKAASKVALTTDDWTSNKIRPYNVVTAHFVNEEGQLTHLLLDFKHHPYPHNANSLVRLIRDVMKTSELKAKVSTVTTDNASSNVSAFNVLGKEDGLNHVRCLAHVLNLVVNAGLIMMKEELRRLRDIVTSLRSAPKRLEIMEGMAKGLKVEFRKPSIDVPARWNSTLYMIKQIKSSKRVLKCLEGTPNFEDIIIEDSMWEELGRLEDVLTPFE